MIDISVPAQGATHAPADNSQTEAPRVETHEPMPDTAPVNPVTSTDEPANPFPVAQEPSEPIDPMFTQMSEESKSLDARMRDRMDHLFPESSRVALTLKGSDSQAAYQNVLVSEQTGQAQQIVAADPKAARESAKMQETIEALTGFPSTARWAMQNPESAKVAQENWGDFTMIESNVRAWSGLHRAVGEATDNFSVGWDQGALVAQVGESFYRDPNSERSQALNRRYEAFNADITPEQTESVFFTMGQILGTMAYSGQSMARGAAQVLIPAIPAMAMAGPAGYAATGAIAAGAGLVAVWNSTREIEAGMFLRDAMSRGVRPEDARATAEVVGAVNGLLETSSDLVMGQVFGPMAKTMLKSVVAKTGVSRLLPSVGVAQGLQRPTRWGVLRQAGLATGANATMESTTEVLQDITSKFASEVLDVAQGLKDRNELYTEEGRAQLWEQTKQSWGQIWKATALLGTAFSVAGLPANLRQAQDAAMAQHDFIDALNKASGSEMGQKYPEVMNQYQTNALKEMGSDQVFVDNTAFAQAMRQANVTLQDLERVDPDIAAAVQKATDEGGDVKIDTDKFVKGIVGTDLGNALTPDVRLTEDSLSARELADRQAQAETLFAQAMQAAENPEVQDIAKQHAAELKEISDSIYTQVKAAGRNAKEARSDAALIRNFFATQSTRLGVTPKQLYEMLPVTVQNGQIQPDATSQGNRGTYSPSAMRIQLTPKADASTFLHETGHFFLDATMRLARHQNATVQMQQDVQTLLDWFGVESLDAWEALGPEGQRKYHEQFAYNYERYLFEGEAPSGRMAALFKRLTDWLKEAYTNLKSETAAIFRGQFNEELPELSDDVRRVMDRLIASDVAVGNAVRARALEPIVAQRDRGNMTDTEWAEYLASQQEGVDEAKALMRVRSLRDAKRLISRIDEERRTARATAKNKRAEVKAKVQKELRMSPFYRAKHFLQTGEMISADGEMTKYQNHRLRTEDNTTKNPKIANLTTRENGVSADWVASTFNLGVSGREFVSALIERPNFNDAVNAQVEQIMDEEFSHLEDLDVINQQVAEAISNEAFSRMIATEYKALKSVSQPARLIAEYAKIAAETIINRSRFTEISTARYARTEAKSRRQAERAMAKGDLESAAEYKRQELLNHELARLATEVDVLKRRLATLRKEAFKPNSKLAKTRDMDHVQIVRALMAEYGMTTDVQSNTVESALNTLSKNDADFAASLRDLVGGVKESVGRRQGNQLTLRDVRTIYTALKAEWDLSRSSKTSLIDGQKLEQDILLAELKTTFGELMEKGRRLKAGPMPTGSETWGHRMTERILGFNAGLRRMDSWCRSMDGGKRGPFTRYLYEPIRDAVDAFNARKQDALKQLIAILKPIQLTDERYQAEELVSETWPKPSISKVQILHALLHCGNSSNKKKLLLGYGWGTIQRDPITGEERLDSSRWDAFINRMVQQGVLTKTDFDAVQAVWDLFESIKPDSQKAHKEIYGYYFDEITAEPVVTPFGVYRGGYAPAIVDPSAVDEAGRKSMQEQLGMVGDSFMMPQAPNGFTKQRVENYTKPLLLDLGLLAGHVDKVLRFAYIAPRVREVYRLVGSSHSPLVKLINQYDPRIVKEMIIPWLARAQGQYVSKPSDTTKGSKDIDNFWRALRTNSSMAVMAGNVLNTLQQYTGLSIAVTRVKGKYLRRALVQAAASPHEARSFIVTKSVWMQNRLAGNLFELSGEIESLITPGSKLRDARVWITQHGYFMQQFAQNTIDVPIWMGAYAEAIDQGMSDRDAVRHADGVIRETQGSFSPEDMSRFEAGTPASRLFTMFYSYFNMQYNLLATELGHSWINREYAHAAYVYFTALVVPTLMSRALMDAAGGLDTGDDDEFDAIDLLRVSATEVAAANLALMPVLGNAVNYMFGLGRSDRYVPTPVVTTLETFGRLGGYLAAAADPDKEVNLRRATKDTLNAISYATGIPLGQFGKPLGYAVGVGTREFTAQDASDIVRGLISGRDVNQ